MKKISLSTLISIGFFVPLLFVRAGFGITPPYVENNQLTRGSTYEQRISLVRNNPDEDLKVELTVNVPKAESWFFIDKGNEFLMPKGETRVPILVRITVPLDAEFGDYRGNIRVLMSSVEGPQAGTVGIALGAQVDVNISVIEKKIFEFKVRGIALDDLEEGYKFWWMHIPAKIKFAMQIENTGNVPAAPTRVEMDIYDTAGKELLESVVNSNKIEFVTPFETKTVMAELPTKIPAGSYRVRYRIYAIDKIVQENEVRMSILPRGTLGAYIGYAFPGVLRVLPLRDRIILGAGTFVLFAVFILVFWITSRKILRWRRK